MLTTILYGLAGWIGLNVLAVIGLLIGGGDPEANAHPQKRFGGYTDDDWSRIQEGMRHEAN
jgi:hypothetical protein